MKRALVISLLLISLLTLLPSGLHADANKYPKEPILSPGVYKFYIAPKESVENKYLLDLAPDKHYIVLAGFLPQSFSYPLPSGKLTVSFAIPKKPYLVPNSPERPIKSWSRSFYPGSIAVLRINTPPADFLKAGFYTLTIYVKTYNDPVTVILIVSEEPTVNHGSISNNTYMTFYTAEGYFRTFRLNLPEGLYYITIEQKVYGTYSPVAKYATMSFQVSYDLDDAKPLSITINGLPAGSVLLPAGSGAMTFSVKLFPEVAKALTETNIVQFCASLSNDESLVVSDLYIYAYTTAGYISGSNTSHLALLNATITESELSLHLSLPSFKGFYVIQNPYVPNKQYQVTLSENDTERILIYVPAEDKPELIAFYNSYGYCILNITIERLPLAELNAAGSAKLKLNENLTEGCFILDLPEGIWKLKFRLLEGDNWTATVKDIKDSFTVQLEIYAGNFSSSPSWLYYVPYKQSIVNDFVNESLSFVIVTFDNSTKSSSTFVRKYENGYSKKLLIKVQASQLANATDNITVEISAECVGNIVELKGSAPYELSVDNNTDVLVAALRLPAPVALVKGNFTLTRGTLKYALLYSHDDYADALSEIGSLVCSEFSSDLFYVMTTSGTLPANRTVFLPVLGTKDAVLVLWAGYNSSLSLRLTLETPVELKSLKVEEPIIFAKLNIPTEWAVLELQALNPAYVAIVDSNGQSVFSDAIWYLGIMPGYSMKVRFRTTGEVYAFVFPGGYEEALTLTVEETQLYQQTFYGAFWKFFSYALPAGIAIGFAIYHFVVRRKFFS